MYIAIQKPGNSNLEFVEIKAKSRVKINTSISAELFSSPIQNLIIYKAKGLNKYEKLKRIELIEDGKPIQEKEVWKQFYLLKK